MGHCAQCGRALPPQGKFCPACGTVKRAVSPSPARHEGPLLPAKSRGGLSRWDIGALAGGAVSAGAWYYWSTMDKGAPQDSFTHLYIMGFTAAVVFLRKRLDRLPTLFKNSLKTSTPAHIR
jgi:hypothetical protein